MAQIDVHAIVEIDVLRSRAVSASGSVSKRIARYFLAGSVSQEEVHAIVEIQRAQTHREVLPRRQRVCAQVDVHAMVEILVLRSRAVSASRSAISRDSNRINIQRAQTHRGVLPRRQRVCAQIDVHAIVGILVLRSRAVSASRYAISRDSNHINIQRSSNANVPRRIDVDFSVSQRSFTQVDIVSVATAFRTLKSAIFTFPSRAARAPPGT